MAKRTTRSAKRAAPSARRGAKTTATRKSAATGQMERRQKTPATLRLRSFQPAFTVNDLERSVRFYTDTLGFIVGDRWTDDGGKLRGVMLKAGACELGLSQDDWAKGRDRPKGQGVRVWCTTAHDIDALASRIKASGGRLIEGPMDQPWGGRSLSVDDLDGFHLTIYREK